jgi:hypothetical protein
MPDPQSAAAAAIADARIPPGDDYEEIREQVRMKNRCYHENGFVSHQSPFCGCRIAIFQLPTLHAL